MPQPTWSGIIGLIASHQRLDPFTKYFWQFWRFPEFYRPEPPRIYLATNVTEDRQKSRSARLVAEVFDFPKKKPASNVIANARNYSFFSLSLSFAYELHVAITYKRNPLTFDFVCPLKKNITFNTASRLGPSVAQLFTKTVYNWQSVFINNRRNFWVCLYEQVNNFSRKHDELLMIYKFGKWFFLKTIQSVHTCLTISPGFIDTN